MSLNGHILRVTLHMYELWERSPRTDYILFVIGFKFVTGFPNVRLWLSSSHSNVLYNFKQKCAQFDKQAMNSLVEKHCSVCGQNNCWVKIVKITFSEMQIKIFSLMVEYNDYAIKLSLQNQQQTLST